MNMKGMIGLTGLALAALVSGCMSFASMTVEKDGGVYDVRKGSMIIGNRVRVLERSVDINQNGLMIAQVRGQNVSRRDLQFEYRFLWKDASGRVLRAGTSIWRPLHATAKQAMFMSATATSAEATDFLMEVRFVRDASNW